MMVNEDKIATTGYDLRYNWTNVIVMIGELMVQWMYMCSVCVASYMCNMQAFVRFCMSKDQDKFCS